jgi:hypothetical protein
VSTGLGANVDTLVNQSPTLSQGIKDLKAHGWTIRYSNASENGAFTDDDAHTIVIRSSDQNNPANVARSLSHELGHAQNPVPPISASGLTRAEYIQKNTDAQLASEGAATLNNAKVRAEIMKSGGQDIGISGSQTAKYDAIYNQYSSGKLTKQQAEAQIGQVYGNSETTSNTNQNYRAYYSQTYATAWDQAYPNKPKDFRAP